MDKFKHINFDVTRRKLNNWKRRINSNTLNMGTVKIKKPIEEVVDSIIPSEISSLCSDDNIFKLTAKKPHLKINTNPIKRVRPKKIDKPISPLVFLDLKEFKKNKIIKKEVKYEQVVKHEVIKPSKIKAQHHKKSQSQLLHKPKPVHKKTINKLDKKIVPKPKLFKKRKEEIYKIKTKIINKNNKKCLEEAKYFSLDEIKQNLNKKCVNISDKAPEKLVRNLYLLCNINV